MTNTQLIFAIPSKGRLKTQCESWLKDRGLSLEQIGGERSYSARLIGSDDIDIRLMSSSEIAKGLLNGEIHAGITGEDLIREQSAISEDLVEIKSRLGFGNADVVVAVPDGWLDVNTMEDLAEVASEIRKIHGQRLRVATKFTRLTTEFFQKNNVNDYSIVYSSGATEGTPSNGVAEAIVDITTSGATLFANNLKILSDGLILKSEACLIVSKSIEWNETGKAILNKLLSQI